MYTDRIHHTATESGLVVSISYRPHFKRIAPSLHTPSLTTRNTDHDDDQWREFMALIPCRSIRQMLVNFSRPQQNIERKYKEITN